MVFDIFGAHRLLLASPGLLWVGFGAVVGVSGGAFWLILFFRRRLRSENFKMFENDDILNEIAVCSRPQGLQNEIQIDPETIKREQWKERGRRAEKRATLQGKVAYPRYCMRFRGGPRAEGTQPDCGNRLGSPPRS